MKDHAAAVVSDAAFEKRAERWPESTPDTKEAYFIRDVFDSASLPSSRNDLLSYDFALRATPSPRRHVPPGCSRDRRQVRSRDPVFFQSPFWCANVALTVNALPPGGYRVAIGDARPTRAAGASVYTTLRTMPRAKRPRYMREADDVEA